MISSFFLHQNFNKPRISRLHFINICSLKILAIVNEVINQSVTFKN